MRQRTLVFAATENAARDQVAAAGLAWRDVLYIGTPHTLRGLNTRGVPRIRFEGADHHRLASPISESLWVSDQVAPAAQEPPRGGAR